jgi:hypothetical protein
VTAVSNRIRTLELIDRSLAAEAELWVRVDPEQPAPGLELRGRLMGPRCRYSSTVEVAYPLRPFPRPPQGLTGLAARVAIPEASLWDPESPFFYEGPVELWQDGRRCDRVVVRHGLRSVSLGPRGLRWNGQPLALRGREVDRTPEEQEAQAWHDGGVNLLLAPATKQTAALWDIADRVGFAVIGRLSRIDDDVLALLGTLETHPCQLGWLLEESAGDHANVERLASRPRTTRLGARLEGPCDDWLEARIAFLVGPADQAADLAAVHRRPLLLVGEGGADDPLVFGRVGR